MIKKDKGIYNLLLGMLIFAALQNSYYIFYSSPPGFSLDKVFLIISCYFFYKLIGVSSFFKRTQGGAFKNIIILFFITCLIAFVRGVFTGIAENRLQNAFNPQFGFSVLVPFAMLIPFNKRFKFEYLYRILIFFLKIGVCLIPLLFISDQNAAIVRPFIEPSFFLLMFIGITKNKKEKVLIIAGIVGYLLLGVLEDNRSILLRFFIEIAFLFIFTYGEKYVGRKATKRMVYIGVIILPIIVFSIYNSLFSNQDGLSLGGSKKISTNDSRTFLYVEVIGDLTVNNDLIIGKGTLGKYFSPWFLQQMEVDDIVDTYNRSVVEVGVLSYLLRGGLILVILFILLLIITAQRAISSNDIVVRVLFYIILDHFLVSFIENFPRYFIYDIVFWILLGYTIKDVMVKKTTLQSIYQNESGLPQIIDIN